MGHYAVNAGGLFGNIYGVNPQEQVERPNDRVLFIFCHTISMSIFVYSSAFFRLVYFSAPKMTYIVSGGV